MKKLIPSLIFFLAFSAFVNIPTVSALPFFEEGLQAPSTQSVYLPEANAEDYGCLNTTNPMGAPDPLAEVAIPEGDKPLYVLVFVDEEARDKLYDTPNGYLGWRDYTIFQIERGDESLVGYYGIDIRILEVLPWESLDNYIGLKNLFWCLLSEKRHFLDTWYGGSWWANFVDVIVGVTAQTTDIYAGCASAGLTLDRWETGIILRWQNYWMDDNLVQHEFSHLFYAPDHDDPSKWCAMSNEKQYVTYIWEDGVFWVFSHVYYAYLAYEWCADCESIIFTYNKMYADEEYPYILVVRHDPPWDPHGELSVYPGVIVSKEPFQITIEVTMVYSPWQFNFWFVDGRKLIFTNTLDVSVNGKKAVAACYKQTYTSSNLLQYNRLGGNGLKLRLR